MTRTRSLSVALPNTSPTLRSICGRSGCSKYVENGVACDWCNKWYHYNCTGLAEEQRERLKEMNYPFMCIRCIYERNGGHFPPQTVSHSLLSTSTTFTPIPPLVEKRTAGQPEAKNETVKELEHLDSKYNGLFTELTEEISTVRKGVSGLQNALTEIKRELGSLHEFIAGSLPGPEAAQEALRLSAGQIKRAAIELQDKLTREHRIILWGNFKPSTQPTEEARRILASCLTRTQTLLVAATWLLGGRNQSIHGLLVTLPDGLYPGRILERQPTLLRHHPQLRGISLDRPVTERRKERQPRDGQSNFNDSKLNKRAAVVLEEIEVPLSESTLDMSFTTVDTTPPVGSSPTKTPGKSVLNELFSSLEVLPAVASSSKEDIPNPTQEAQVNSKSSTLAARSPQRNINTSTPTVNALVQTRSPVTQPSNSSPKGNNRNKAHGPTLYTFNRTRTPTDLFGSPPRTLHSSYFHPRHAKIKPPNTYIRSYQQPLSNQTSKKTPRVRPWSFPSQGLNNPTYNQTSPQSWGYMNQAPGQTNPLLPKIKPPNSYIRGYQQPPSNQKSKKTPRVQPWSFPSQGLNNPNYNQMSPQSWSYTDQPPGQMNPLLPILLLSLSGTRFL